MDYFLALSAHICFVLGSLLLLLLVHSIAVFHSLCRCAHSNYRLFTKMPTVSLLLCKMYVGRKTSIVMRINS